MDGGTLALPAPRRARGRLAAARGALAWPRARHARPPRTGVRRPGRLIDSGNFATNITAGAKYGYLLVWVIVAANLIAMLVQYLSAKIGIASERNLPELCRDSMPKPVTFGL